MNAIQKLRMMSTPMQPRPGVVYGPKFKDYWKRGGIYGYMGWSWTGGETSADIKRIELRLLMYPLDKP